VSGSIPGVDTSPLDGPDTTIRRASEIGEILRDAADSSDNGKDWRTGRARPSPEVEETTMTLPFRVVALTVVLALLLGGPLSPVAFAQATQPQPDAFKETMKPPAVPAEPPPGRDDVVMSDTFYNVTAGVMSAFLIPGRTITCIAGGTVGVLALVLTFGSAYRGATRALEEGCGGKWIVRGEDLMPDRPPIVTQGQPK